VPVLERSAVCSGSTAAQQTDRPASAPRLTAPGAIAKALTARGIPTARGHRFWTYNPVRALLSRLDRLARGVTIQEDQIDGEQHRRMLIS
jgi:hypothetical protein